MIKEHFVQYHHININNDVDYYGCDCGDFNNDGDNHGNGDCDCNNSNVSCY